MAYVNGTKVDATGTSKTSITSPAISITAGNLIVVFLSYTNPSSITVAVTDSVGNTYVAGTLKTNASPTSSQMFYAYNAAGGSTTITVTTSAAATNTGMVVAQYSGLATGNPLDIEAIPSTGSGTTPRTNSFSTSTANEVIVSGLAGPSFTAVDSGYTNRTNFSYGSFSDGTFTATQSGVTFGGTASPSAVWSMHAMAFKLAGPPPTTAITPNNAGIFYTPGTWTVSSSAAIAVNAGAYFKTLFTGSSVTLNFDVSRMCSSNQTQIFYQIDGQPMVKASLTGSTLVLTMPAATATWSQHFLQVIFKSSTINCPGATGAFRWDPSKTITPALFFTGLTLDNGASVSLPSLYPKRLLILGDSITEGGGASNETAGLDGVDWNDVTLGYAYNLGKALNAEVDVVGWGGQGWNNAGAGGLPTFPNTYNLIYPSAARSFSAYDYIIINMGQNDGTNNVVSYMVSVLNPLVAAASPTAKIFVLGPFSGRQAANLQTAIAATTLPGRLTYIDTTGLFHSALSFDGVHPRGDDALGYIAPGLASKLVPYLTTSAPVFRRMFSR